jgi:hypothetical protein
MCRCINDEVLVLDLDQRQVALTDDYAASQGMCSNDAQNI